MLLTNFSFSFIQWKWKLGRLKVNIKKALRIQIPVYVHIWVIKLTGFGQVAGLRTLLVRCTFNGI